MSEGVSRSAPTPQSKLEDLPPSAKLVAKTIEYEGEMTQSALADSTRLPDRTIRYALNELKNSGLVKSEILITDARKRRYSLTVEAI